LQFRGIGKLRWQLNETLIPESALCYHYVNAVGLCATQRNAASRSDGERQGRLALKAQGLSATATARRSASAGRASIGYVGGSSCRRFAQVKDDALYIGKLAVRAGVQGAGIGRKLVEAARDEARSRGLKMLELQTRIELTENHAMCARMGFVKTAETAHPRFDRPTSITRCAKV
jgi:GNAT superfamily N-acetyltransferase